MHGDPETNVEIASINERWYHHGGKRAKIRMLRKPYREITFKVWIEHRRSSKAQKQTLDSGGGEGDNSEKVQI